MKVLLTGAGGQLAHDLRFALNHHDVAAPAESTLDITDLSSVKCALGQYRPDIVINTAAYVRVDDCEANQTIAYRVNAAGARNVAVATQAAGAGLVHISTDYVFGGENRATPSPYTEFDTPVPLSVYGKSKLAGEEFVRHLCHRHFIVRTSGLFGVAGSAGKGGNFIETMLKLARERDELRVVNDQVFSPTYSADLARKIAELISTEYYGVFHVTNEGSCTWYEFTLEILNRAGLKTKLTPITSDQYPQAAKRPAFSVLDHLHLRLLGMDDMRPWPQALGDYLVAKGHVRI